MTVSIKILILLALLFPISGFSIERDESTTNKCIIKPKFNECLDAIKLNNKPDSQKEFNKIYDFIKETSINGFTNTSLILDIPIDELSSIIYNLDNYINNFQGYMSDARKIQAKDKDNEYNLDNIKKKIEIYESIISNIPYSKSAAMSAIGINYYSILLCEKSSDLCDEYIEKASKYIQLLTTNDELNLLHTSKFSWGWYNDALVREFTTNIYSRNAKQNDLIIDKLRKYKLVVNMFGACFNSKGLVRSSYIDQIWIGNIIPGRGEARNSYFSNDVVINSLIKINNDIIGKNLDESLNIYKSEISKLENNDFTVVLHSFKSKKSASIKLSELKNKQKKTNSKKFQYYIDKAKIIKPNLGSYWGVGIGLLSQSEANEFKEKAESWGFPRDYFITRPQVESD